MGQRLRAVEALRQRLAVEQGHCQVVDAVDLVNGVDRAKVRMVEGGGDFRLAIEALQDLGAIFGAEVRDFEGDLAM